MITHSSNQGTGIQDTGECNWHDEIDISKDVMCMLFLIVEDQLILWEKSVYHDIQNFIIRLNIIDTSPIEVELRFPYKLINYVHFIL